MHHHANLLAAAFMVIASSWPQMTGQGRSAKEFSDLNDSLLVPYGAAFSIWGPIFLLSLIYAFITTWRINRTRAIFTRTRSWTAVGFIFTGLWSLTAYFAPLATAKWATVLIFIPIIACFLRALYIFHNNREQLDAAEQRLIIIPVALIAGWTSLAAFLNLAPLMTAWIPASELVLNMLILSAALIFALTMIFRLGRIWSYGAPIIWGLGWLSYEHFTQDAAMPAIGYLSVLGIVMIMVIIFRQPKPKQ